MNYKNKIYFFPAVLPLMAVAPWLLTAFGTAAGFLISFFGRSRYRRASAVGLVVFLVCILAAAVLLWPALRLRFLQKGTHLTTESQLPRTEILGPLEPGEELPIATRAAWEAWKPLWSTATSRRSLSDPVLSGPLAIVGTWEGTVDAFALQNGKPLWSVKKRHPIFALTGASSSLLLAGEGVHTSPTSSLTAIRLPEGLVLWDREFQGHLESPAAYSEKQNRIWVGTGPAGLWCLDSRNGSVIWHKGGIHVDSTPLLFEGKVFFLGEEEEKKESIFFALDENTGSELWRVPLPGQPWGSPILHASKELVLATSGIGQIGITLDSDKGWAHGISLKDRKLRWSRPLPGNPLESSIYLPTHGILIITVTKGEIIAIRSDTGQDVWHTSLGQQIVAQPDLNNSQHPPRLVSLATDGKLRIQSALTGHILDEHSFTPGNNSAPRFLSDGLLLALPQSIERYRW